jgi:alpha-L-rhamnosidase
MRRTSLIAIAAVLAMQAQAQQLDPARNPASLHTPPPSHLTEQFIWTRDDAAAPNPELQSKVRGLNDKIAPHYFRAHFSAASLPANATLYLAGPRSATVTLNGVQVMQFGDDGAPSKGFNVVHAEVAHALRRGNNVLAVEEVRGHSSLHTGASPTINQVTYGEVLAVKIVPASIAVDAPPLLVSDTSWRSTLTPSAAWSAPAFDDSAWPTVQSLGILGSKSDFLQWSADAGLYAWPGYSGIGPAMRTFRLPVIVVLDPSSTSLTLDFGREIAGRLHVASTAQAAIEVATSYGESLEEANGHPYLGIRKLTVAAHAEAFGPKSAFRYVHLTLPAGTLRQLNFDVEGIAYPVTYAGSFASSDPQLNRIWETAAYTAHLCMGEGIWDAPKRDRGRWMGDLDVTGRTISSVFADRDLMEATMDQVLGDSPVRRDVNTIAGYSALWITGQADFFLHLGDLDYLRRLQPRLLELLAVMDAELDPTGLFTNPAKHKVFVDWSNDFSADTPEARAATHFEFYLAYRQAAFLLTQLNDRPNADRYSRQADRLLAAAQHSLVSPATGTFGNRWQTNAMAVVSGAATPAERSAIWKQVLARVPDPASTDVVTPYYGFYVLSAMANLDHRAEALAWMRLYWGGMLAEGATSFWEAYDPHWPKQDFHAYLEADGKRGYYTSLAHGWSSGPAAWLMSELLGIQPTARGFAEVTIRPDLAGLTWIQGAEPTPRGLIRVEATATSITVEIPPGTTARVSLPFAHVFEAGHSVPTTLDADPRRSIITLHQPGRHMYTGAKP